MRTLLHHPHRSEVAVPVAVRPTGVAATKLGCVPGTSRRVLDELRADLAIVHTIQAVAEKPRPTADFFAHYNDDLRVQIEMHHSLQAIAGILFESDDALEAVIVEALLPIAELLAAVSL